MKPRTYFVGGVIVTTGVTIGIFASVFIRRREEELHKYACNKEISKKIVQASNTTKEEVEYINKYAQLLQSIAVCHCSDDLSSAIDKIENFINTLDEIIYEKLERKDTLEESVETDDVNIESEETNDSEESEKINDEESVDKPNEINFREVEEPTVETSKVSFEEVSSTTEEEIVENEKEEETKSFSLPLSEKFIDYIIDIYTDEEFEKMKDMLIKANMLAGPYPNEYREFQQMIVDTIDQENLSKIKVKNDMNLLMSKFEKRFGRLIRNITREDRMKKLDNYGARGVK